MDSLAATEAVSRIFSDTSVLQAMLAFEAALARAEAQCGVIPARAAAAITEAARAPETFDCAELARQSLRAGTPAIPLVRVLTEKVRAQDQEAAVYVHWGATSQDVVDTALVLLLAQCRGVLVAGHQRVQRGLRRLSQDHANTVMLARTLLQPAPPITFGLKAAGWLASLRRGWSRVDSRFAESHYLQFGGASPRKLERQWRRAHHLGEPAHRRAAERIQRGEGKRGDVGRRSRDRPERPHRGRGRVADRE